MAEPIQLTLGDKTYPIGHFTKAVQAKYTAYIKGEMLTALIKEKERLGGEYAGALQQHVFDCANGKFDFYSKMWWDHVQQPKHFAELFWLCMSTQQLTPKSHVEKLIQEYPQEFLTVWQQLLEEDTSKKD